MPIRPALIRRAAAVALFVAAPASAAPPEVWEFRAGGWQQVAAPPATQPAIDPTLDAVDALLDRGRHVQARKLALAWEKANKSSPNRDRALMQIAAAYYEHGDRLRAFYHLDELMDTYPESRLFYPALERQYAIAEAFLNGYKRRLFGLPLVTFRDEAVEMMYRIQQRSPGSPLAERAMLRTADHYFATSKYDLAADAYAAFVRGYPRSPSVPRVRLRAAYASLAQFRGLRYDATPLIDARTQFEAIIADYPQLAGDENLRDLIDRIDTTFARKLSVTAAFYRRTSEPAAAAYTYRYLVNAHPDTREAEEARQALTLLPTSATHAPVPPAGGGQSPSVPAVTAP